jgi:hypothetical protein
MLTMLPAAGSPALKAGTATNAPTTDERGDARPAGAIDLGAVQVSVVTAVPAPIVLTAPASAITTTGATVNAGIDPNGAATTYYFQYGTATTYGSKTSVLTLPAASAGVPVNAKLTGLKPNTTYHYRIVATNPGGTSTGSDGTFTTLRPKIAGLTASVTPRHARKFPYKYKFTGRVRLPRGGGGSCSGKITVLIKRGKKTVLRGRGSVFAGCSWKVSVSLNKRKSVPKHGTLSVTVSFGGNSTYASHTNKPFTILYG